MNRSNPAEVGSAEECTVNLVGSRKRSLSTTVKSKRFRDGKSANELLQDVRARVGNDLLELWDKKHPPKTKACFVAC